MLSHVIGVPFFHHTLLELQPGHRISPFLIQKQSLFYDHSRSVSSKMMHLKLATIITALAALAPFAVAAIIPEMSIDTPLSRRQELTGQATFYGGNVQGGACSFSTYTLPAGLYGTALSDSNWNNSANCGGCVSVTYGGNSITAMVSLLSDGYIREPCLTIR